MKIALAGLTYPFRGGISQYTTLLYEALGKKHDVRLFALKRQYPALFFPGKSQIDENQSLPPVPHEACIDSLNPLSWLKTFGHIRRFQPELLILAWWHPFFAPSFGSIAHLSTCLAGVPCCYLCHNVLPHKRSIIDRILLHYAFSAGTVFITHSRADSEELRSLLPRARIYINPHPSYSFFAEQEQIDQQIAKNSLGLDGRRVLLFFGFIRRYKGLKYLLEAMTQLESEKGYHLLVVGEFYEDMVDYRQQLDCLVANGQLTLVDRYIRDDEVPFYFAAADVVMLPYLSASQSGVAQIAYAFHKPIIGTNTGGLPEVVLDGKTGYIVPPGNAGAIARSIDKFFENRMAQAFEENIRREADRYSWEHLVETVEKMIAELRWKP